MLARTAQVDLHWTENPHCRRGGAGDHGTLLLEDTGNWNLEDHQRPERSRPACGPIRGIAGFVGIERRGAVIEESVQVLADVREQQFRRCGAIGRQARNLDDVGIEVYVRTLGVLDPLHLERHLVAMAAGALVVQSLGRWPHVQEIGPRSDHGRAAERDAHERAAARRDQAPKPSMIPGISRQVGFARRALRILPGTFR
jgi:hypothetical protein